MHTLARLFPRVWQVHPFREGNTRTVVMMMTLFVEHYLLRNCPFSAVTDDVVGNLQQSAHLHLPHTGIGHAHGIIKKRKSKHLLQQRGKLPLLRAAELFQDRQKILLLFCQQH